MRRGPKRPMAGRPGGPGEGAGGGGPEDPVGTGREQAAESPGGPGGDVAGEPRSGEARPGEHRTGERRTGEALAPEAQPAFAGSGALRGGIEGAVEISAALSPEVLMRYLDGELAPPDRQRVEQLLAGATEIQRELMVYRHIHEDLSEIRLRTGGGRRSVWERVNQRLTRPMGWLFLCAGVGSWLLYLAWVYLSSATPTWEKLMSSAIVIGVLLLFASVIHDRYREWLTDPYRDVER
jgi:hypothetical protein